MLMSALIYLHGFLSSPRSHKAVQVRDWLAARRPDIDYYCPLLTPCFSDTRQTLETLTTRLLPQPVILMGSSLGGYWATFLAEKYNLRAVLINPVTSPAILDRSYPGEVLKNYHTDDTYILKKEDLSALQAAYTPAISCYENYWLMVQTGDEVLDYRLAADKYKGCRQLVVQGGDHGFQNFDQHIPAAINFLLREDTDNGNRSTE
jgi:hypothetical protein